jgi:hypothetical protein
MRNRVPGTRDSVEQGRNVRCVRALRRATTIEKSAKDSVWRLMEKRVGLL